MKFPHRIILSLALLTGCLQAPTILPMEVSCVQEVDECTICLSTLSYATIQLPCKHKLHRKCLQEMLNRKPNATCTLCRGPIPKQIHHQLSRTITCEELLNDLGGYVLHLLSPKNLTNFKEALNNITSCEEELTFFKKSLDTTDETCNSHILAFTKLLEDITPEHLFNNKSLQKLYNQWGPVTQSQVVFFLKDIVEAHNISKESIMQLRSSLESHPHSDALLDEINPALDMVEELADVLEKAPGRAFYRKWFTWFSGRTLFEVLQKSDIPTLLEQLSLNSFYLTKCLTPLEENKEMHTSLQELQLACYLCLHEKALTLNDFTQLLSAKLQDVRLLYKNQALLPIIKKYYIHSTKREDLLLDIDNEIEKIQRTPLELLRSPVQNNNNAIQQPSYIPMVVALSSISILQLSLVALHLTDHLSKDTCVVIVITYLIAFYLYTKRFS